MKISEMTKDEAIKAGVQLEWGKDIYTSVIVKAIETDFEWLYKAETKNLIAEISNAYKKGNKETYVEAVLKLRWEFFTRNMTTITF